MEMRLCIMIQYNVSQLFIRDTFILNDTDWSPSILLFSQHHFDSRVPIVCVFFCYFHSIRHPPLCNLGDCVGSRCER